MTAALARELKDYRRRVKRLLLVKTEASERFLRELEQNARDYMEENHVFSFIQVEQRFGAPEQIAREFFAQTDIETVRRKLSLKKRIAAAALAALLLWSAALGALYLEARNDMHGAFYEDAAVSEAAQ